MSEEKLKPNWIVGFTDGEGFFSVCIFLSLNKRTLRRHVRVNQSFGITQKECNILLKVKEFFGFGSVLPTHKRTGEQYFTYRVGKHQNLKVIMEFFTKHPLHTSKREDFKQWKEIWHIRERKEHYHDAGILKIAEIRQTMNMRGGKRRQFHSVEEIRNWLKIHPKKVEDFYPSEDSIIRQNLRKTDAEIAKLLNRKVYAVTRRRVNLGLKKYGVEELKNV